MEEHWKTTRVVVSVLVVGCFFNFRFADDIVNAEKEEQSVDIVTSSNTTCTRFKMKVVPDKTNIMTNNLNGFQREI